jgi:hypothetical protein
MRKLIIASLLFLVINCPNLSAESEEGGYAGAFLKLAVQARPASMGGAYIGVSDDAAGQLFNPAGTAVITQNTLASSYRIMKLDRKLGFASIIFPTRGQSSLGLSWLYAGYGEVAARNSSGQDLGSTISSNEHVFGISFAKQFTPFMGLGTKLSYFYKTLSDINANSIGINIGALVTIDSLVSYGAMEGKQVTDIKLGLVFSNIAAGYRWSEQSAELAPTQRDEFPLAIGFGASCRAFQRRLLLAVDLEKNIKQTVMLRFGGEYNLENRLLLRAGLNDGIITAGFGYNFNLKNLVLGFNYAFSADRADEGDDHIISLDLRF